MTSNGGRELDFVGDGPFEAELYLDHPAGGPNSVTRHEQAVSAADTLRVVLLRAGGFAAVMERVTSRRNGHR